MKQVKVTIEEVLSREIYIDVPKDMEPDDAIEKALDIVREQYFNNEIELDYNDYEYAQYCGEDIESGITWDWDSL